MGQALAASITEHSDLDLVGLWQRGQSLSDLVAAADVVVDFSLPEATETILDAAVRHRKPLVCGVSGLDEERLALMDEAAASIPLVFDRNMSLGIAILERSVQQAAASLGSEFDVRVSEVHHTQKKDAPSGTALKLAEAIARSRGDSGTGSVRFEVERRGDVPGEHEVTMASATETLTFAHSVTTRQVFVEGALVAARWVVGKASGRYSMQDVLFSHIH